MPIVRGENGAALVTALMLTMLALVIAMTLLYAVTTGTRISASQKRYRSALAAAHGGVEFSTGEILRKLMLLDSATAQTTLQRQFSSIDLQLSDHDCLQQKLNSPTANWNACDSEQSSWDPGRAPDIRFTLRGLDSQPGFSVSTKIVDTVPGNSDRSGSADDELIDPGSSVSGADAGVIVRPPHVPALYNISVEGVGTANPREKARLSVLYVF